MTQPRQTPARKNTRPTRLVSMAALAVAELLFVILAYQVMASIECRQTEIESACRALRSMTARGLSVMTVMAVYFSLRPLAFRALLKHANLRPGHRGWLGLHALGVALIFLPLPLFGAAEINRFFGPTLGLLLAGGFLAAISAFLWITPFSAWRTWMRNDSYFLPLALFVGFLVPDIADLIRPIWEWATLSNLTFFLVYVTLVGLGFDVGVDPPTYVIGVDDFYVQIASQCSGVEGIALITIFMGFYAVLMRPDLRQGRFWFVLFPLAVFCSWIFNILRIAILIVIGARMSPEHALNGFHSYAGWLMFTALALSIVAVAHRTSWLHRTFVPRSANRLLRSDALAASIVPFIVMMMSGVFVAAFWPEPATGYPLRAAMMLAALLFFWPTLRKLCQVPDLLAMSAGFAVGGLWLLTAPVETGPPGSPPSALWILLRLFGTVALVPLIEELFFRGYLLRRLMRGGVIWTLFAIALSCGLFGLMHDRLLAGSLSGLVFAVIYLRRNRLWDAIVAHMTANAVIAIVAMITAKWALI